MDENFERYLHSVEVDDQKRLITIYRVDAKGEKSLFTSVDYPVKSFDQDAEGYREFVRLLGENLLIDSLNSTRKCNSSVWFSGAAARASWPCLTDQRKRSTHERLYPADPRTTVSNSGLIENGSAPNPTSQGGGCPDNHDQSRAATQLRPPGLSTSPSPLPGSSQAGDQDTPSCCPDNLAASGEVGPTSLESRADLGALTAPPRPDDQS